MPKKLAALAEAHNVGVVPHNPLSPVSTAAYIPNFALQEYPLGEQEPPKSEIVKSTLRNEDGFIIIPDAPGMMGGVSGGWVGGGSVTAACFAQ